MTCPTADGGTTPATSTDVVTFVANVTVSTLAGGADTTVFDNPTGVAIAAGGSLVVADTENSYLDTVTSAGAVTVLTHQATFVAPFGVAYDAAHTALYATTDANASGVKDSGSGKKSGTIWKVTGAGVASNLTLTGPGYLPGWMRGLGVLSDGRLVASDRTNHAIWVIDPSNGHTTLLAGSSLCVGNVNGTGGDASFVDPYGLAVLPDDSIVVADYGARVLRKVTKTGVVTTFAGDGGVGTIDGPAATSRFIRPQAVAADASGVVYVTDTDAHRIRRIATNGTVTTVAGNGTAGFMDGTGSAAAFYTGEGIAVSADGTTIYVADGTGGDSVPYHRVRKITVAP